MPRPRPVHKLSDRESELATAIAAVPETIELKRARKLKEKIEAAWAARGMRVVVTLEPVIIYPNPGDTNPRRAYALRSETLNGWLLALGVLGLRFFFQRPPRLSPGIVCLMRGAWARISRDLLTLWGGVDHWLL